MTLSLTKTRTYEATHPWINFTLSLNDVPYQLWTMLGECQSKCAHLAGIPLMPSTASKLHQIFMAKGVQATTAIEGNSLSVKNVLDHMKGRELNLPRSQQYLKQEIENVISACDSITNTICETAPGDRIAMTMDDIKSYNKMVLNGLEIPDGGIAGEISPWPVGVSRYRGAPREDCEYLLTSLCNWLALDWVENRTGLKTGAAILKAIIAHLYLAWIHPFPDGNGRTSRLLEFRILLESGVPTPAAHLMSNHYNKTRERYYQELDKSSQTNPVSFIVYAVRGLRDGLRQQIRYVQKQQREVIWRDYVYEQFKDDESWIGRRRRSLVIAVSDFHKPIPRQKITEISPKVAGLYANKTERTVNRDLKILCEMGLLVSTRRGGYMAAKFKIRAFLPRRRKPSGVREFDPGI